ncbi:MAG: phage tail tape measure protein, partial [Candidatus Contendobacter sp.]|nr:phage tail tape measure protein [Candidatus Contendobacter sp.]
MADRNLVLQLLITAKDEASAIFGKIFKGLNDSTNVIATKMREAFTGLFGGGLDSAAEFEAQLSKVQAKGGLTAETMAELKQVATDLGAKFGVSGTEAAKGMESLAAAGLDAQQIIQTLPSVMALAQVEAISMDDASAKLANSLTAVGLGFDQAGRMADVLSKAALESTTSASAVAEALSVAGGIATTSGLSFEQTAAALTALAKGGIEGSAAGTSLSAILTQLINPASTASIALNNLGISSRDLGDVIGALQQRGDSANTAILAFGETAGPGLRTLITQGQAGLNDLTAAMQNAGGSAQATADTMSGNLQGAMDSLAAAWESVKTALFDPVLEPLTKAANDFASALNTNLKEGALKPVQEAIKSFAENSIVAVREFVGSFDFSQVGPAITQFATGAKTAFDSLADGGRQAANSVVLVWNGVQIAVKGVAIILAGFTATIATSIEGIVSTLNAVGLASDDLNVATKRMAESSRDNVTSLRDSIVTDAGEMKTAWDKLTSETEKTAAANQRLKNSLPVQEIKEITYSLKDYEQFAKLANSATEKASKEYETGQITGAQYAAIIQSAAEANTNLSRATDAAAAAAAQAKGKTSDHAKELQGQIGRLEVGVTQAKKYADAVEGVVNAESEGIKTAIRLAQAKGDTVEVQRLTIRLTEQEADGAVRIAKAKQLEQEAEAAVAKKKLELAQIQREKNQITAEDLTLAELTAQKEVAEAEAAGVNTQAQIQLAEALRQVNAAKSGSVGATNQNTESTAQNTDAQERNTKVVNNLAKMHTGLIQALTDARQRMNDLSETAGAYFEAMLQGTLNAHGLEGAFQSSGVAAESLSRALEGGSGTTEALAKFETNAAQAGAALGRARQDMLQTVNMLDIYTTSMEIAEAATRKTYYEQAAAAERMRMAIEEMTNSGKISAQQLTLAANAAKGEFNLLDQEDLSGLTGSIENANQKLREM